jgi:hypothetical protein
MAAEMRGERQWFPGNFRTSRGIIRSEAGHQPGGIMQRNYDGLPAAPSVEQAIIQAQLLILKARERDGRSQRRHRVRG